MQIEKLSINTTPTNYYSTNFKAKTDYSKIYKEMEEISLKRDEKIIPKVAIYKKLSNLKKIHNINLFEEAAKPISQRKTLLGKLAHIACIPFIIIGCMIYLVFGNWESENHY